MISAPKRPDEAASLAALRALEVLDTGSEAPFDALVQAASAVCGAPVSLISLIDADRQWFKANLGLPGVTETPRDLAFCAHAVLGDGLFEVPDALHDERFRDNPLVTEAPNIRFYAGMPLRTGDGSAIGTLCVIDHAPRRLDERQREVLRQLALAASQMLAGRLALRQTQAAQKSLHARLGDLRRLLDALPSLLSYWSPDLVCRFANRAYADFYGLDSDALVGMHLSELLGPALFESNRPIIEAAFKGDPQTLQRVIPGPGASARHVRAHYQPDVADGAVLGLLVEVTDLTSLMLAESRASALEQERDRLAMVARLTSNAVVITDPQRRITWVNAGFERITGYSAAEAIGRTPGELLNFEGTDPNTVKRLEVAVKAGQGFIGELRNRGKHGRLYWSAIESRRMRDEAGRLTGFMSIESDITERRQAEAEARHNLQLLHAAIEAIDEAFVLYDPDDRLVFCNDKYRELFTTPISSCVVVPGARFEDIVRHMALAGRFPEAVGRVDEWVAEALAIHRAGKTRMTQPAADGRTLRFINRRMPDGHMVGFRFDITDLITAREAAEQASRAKSDFIATMSHELRTPLQSINGYAELGQHMAQADGQAPFASMFGTVLSAGQEMLSLVNDLLDLSAIDASGMSLSPEPADLKALAAQVGAELESLAGARRIRIELAPAMPLLPVHADARRVQQVIRNVLANAIRFAPPGSAVHIDGTDLGNDGVELTVRDHGPGIPPDELELVFGAFVQSSRTRDGSGGTGLGLAICRRIMTAHGGRVTASNAPEGGAELRLWLPAAPGLAALLAEEGRS